MIRVRDSFAHAPGVGTPTLSTDGLLWRGQLALKARRERRQLPLSSKIRRVVADAINRFLNFFHP